MKPLLKWAGGKRHIAEELLSSFPVDWNKGTYIEPFIGGGAMFLFLAPEKAIIADLNIRLFGFYSHIKSSHEEVFNGIFEIAKDFNEIELEKKKDFYLDLRSKYNSSDVDSLESASGQELADLLHLDGQALGADDFNVWMAAIGRGLALITGPTALIYAYQGLSESYGRR